MISKGNIYTQRNDLNQKYEIFEDIIASENILIERIISSGQKTPEGTWLEQERDEWVILLQGEASLSFEDGSRVDLKPGDYVYIPGNVKHRVDRTSTEPDCIWLAVHGAMGGNLQGKLEEKEED